MPSHGACPCSLSPTHPAVLEMNVAIASSKVTMASLAQANTTVSYATSPTRERRRTVSPSRSSSATRTTTASPPSSSHRNTLERLRASPGANLLAGGIGGLASLVVGHPFDTVKVRLQTMSADNRGKIPYRSATHCLSKMVQREGPSSLFRGMSGLAVFSVPRFAFLFYANSWGRLILPPGEGAGPSLSQILMGGVVSQLVVAPFLVAPLERVKVLLQANPGRFSGQMACLGHIVRTEGPQGLLRGSLLTLVRDVPAFCAYFATYETLRSKFQKEDGTIDLGRTVAIGGLAGVIAWALALPLDSLKNRFQASLNQTSLLGLLGELRRHGGLKQLYRGAGVVLLRAFPANAATFIGYEWTMRVLLLGENLTNKPRLDEEVLKIPKIQTDDLNLL